MKYLSLLVAALLLAGCGGGASQQAQTTPTDPVKPASSEVSFAKDIQPMVNANCMPCHSGAKDAQAKTNWTTYQGVKVDVVAGKPDSSKFYTMLRDGKMPPSGKLDSAKIDLVYRWISQGAKDN